MKFTLTGASGGVNNLTAFLTLYKVSNGVAGAPMDAPSPGASIFDSGSEANALGSLLEIALQTSSAAFLAIILACQPEQRDASTEPMRANGPELLLVSFSARRQLSSCCSCPRRSAVGSP